MESRSIDLTVGDTTVQVDSEGSGSGLVLIHSLLTGPEAFDAVAPVLAQTRRVHRISLPGFGRSTPLPMPNPTVDDLADHVAAALAQLGCDPETIVLGNGLGGFVAAALAIRHGTMLGPFILSNSGAAFSSERASAFGTMSDLVSKGGMSAVVDVAVRRIFPEDYLDAHPAAIEERRSVLEAVDPESFAASCRALADLDLRPKLGTIKNRTLVVAGAADATTPPEMAAELAAGISSARLTVIPECGHCPQLQRPKALLAAVADFVGS